MWESRRGIMEDEPTFPLLSCEVGKPMKENPDRKNLTLLSFEIFPFLLMTASFKDILFAASEAINLSW